MTQKTFSARIRVYLFVYCALALLGMSVSVGFMLVTSISHQWEEMEYQSMQKAAAAKAETIAEWVRKQHYLLHQIHRHQEMRMSLQNAHTEPKDFEAVLLRMQSFSHNFVPHASSTLAITQLDMDFVPHPPVPDLQRLLPHIDVSAPEFRISEPFVYEGKYAILLSTPIFDTQQQRIATNIIVVSLEVLKDIVGENAVLTYGSAKATHFFWPPTREALTVDIRQALDQAQQGQAGIFDNNVICIGYTAVPGTPWIVAIFDNTEPLQSIATRHMQESILHLCLTYLACTGGFWIVSRPLAGKILLHTRDLEESNNKLIQEQARSNELSHKLIGLLEETRLSISRDIHDHTGQLLTTLRLRVENLRDEISETQVACLQHIEEVAHDVQAIQHAVKDIATGLRPPCLSYAGLVSTMEGLLEEYRASGLFIRFFTKDVPPRLPEDVALTIYRMAQEALTNVLRHARADNVHMSLTTSGTMLILSVEDDGRGFDMDRVRKDNSGHLGLILMRERAKLVHGDIFIESAPGKGTSVIAEVPIPCTEE